MKTTKICLLPAVLLALATNAQILKPFPAHWGKPPTPLTADAVPLPDGYGRSSSTLAKWIKENLKKDKEDGASAGRQPLYEINFENAAVGKLPEEFMVLNGEFSVKEEAGNKFLELPGAPLDTFSVQFGPARGADTTVSARVFATGRGRRFPTFGVGLGGVSGHRLVVAPGKKALELWKDDALRASVPFEWKSGVWTLLRLQVRKVQAGEWRAEGKAWSQGGAEPKEWLVHCSATEEPVTGRASVVGSPFAGTPIRFDDLAVREAGK